MVTDFYLGAEMAIDSLQKQGVKINASIFDTGNRGSNITEILENDELKDIDVAIGPFYSKKVDLVAKKVKIPIVFPHYSNKQKDLTASKIIKVAPEKSAYTEYLASYLKNNYNGEVIFVVGDGEANSNNIVTQISTSLKKHDSIATVHILKPEKGYIKKERFTSKMNSEKHNWVIIASENNVTIADVLNNMIRLPDDIKAQVFAINKNKAYDNIDNNKLAHTDFTYVSSSYSNENLEETKSFYRSFNKKNNTIPSSYAIKGFDITYDILMRLASGNNLQKTFKQGTSIRIESKFDYHKKLLGATTNKGLFIVQYNKDLSLSRLQ
jgi:ABC-type branched-subunit amino acid transport system substrate-binding protein